MNRLFPLWLAAALAGGPAPAVPFAKENLTYTVNWPSGLSLGEARLTSARAGEHWKFEFSLDASVPAFSLSDQYSSTAANDFCSLEFVKRTSHGKKQGEEKITFDPQKGTATRATLLPKGGGKSEIAVPACSRDPLAFFYYLRRELAAGRLPSPQTVYFGAAYQVRVDYLGSESVRVNDRPTEADRLSATFKGPASQLTLELFFARDAARTPLLVRVPLPLGTFSMELAR